MNAAASSLLVSTVIPTFNRHLMVQRAVDSALGQTYEHQEIIVVDDGSTDETSTVLHERYGSSIRYVWQKNGGVSTARNCGMRLARGEFIALLDSDDAWHPTKLEKQVAFLNHHPDYGMVLTDVNRVDAAGNVIDVFRRRDVLRVDGDVLADVVLNPSLVPASILIRRHVFERLGGFDESLRTAEDIEFHLRVAAAFKVGIIDEALTIAARANDGLSSEATSDADYVRVVECFVSRERARIAPNIRRRALYGLYERAARSACKSARIPESWRYSALAVAYARSVPEVIRIAEVVALSARVIGARALRRR
jgi:glycosyltransferase involved in cell wall biosynthesis